MSRFLDDHPSLPARLLHQPLNRGLAHSRNTLIEHARGEYLFILNPTGGIYPPRGAHNSANVGSGPDGSRGSCGDCSTLLAGALVAEVVLGIVCSDILVEFRHLWASWAVRRDCPPQGGQCANNLPRVLEPSESMSC